MLLGGKYKGGRECYMWGKEVGNGIGGVSMDGVEKGNCGDGGGGMGMGDIGEVVWKDFVKDKGREGRWYDGEGFIVWKGEGWMVV